MKQLQTIFAPDQVKTDPESLAFYGKDWTTYFDIKASAVVFPETTEQVQKLVLFANEQAIGLVPSGGRTGLSGAACATNEEVVVSFERMNKILDFDPIGQTVKVQAGVITEAVQEYASKNGLYYPVDFAARGSSQIGGNIATNAGGIKVIRYGMTRNWVAGLKVVTGKGEVLELNNSLIKNATGYDLRHLFIGSEGTLGLICEASLQLTAPPPPLQVLIVAVADLDAIMKVFSHFHRNANLVAFEIFSEQALKKVLESTGLQRPFSTTAPFYALIEAEVASPEAEQNLLTCFEECAEKAWILDGSLSQSEAQAKNFWRLREDISESLAKYSPYKNDISVTISKVPAFMQELDRILAKAYPSWEVIWFGHIGDGNLHINILRPALMSKEEFVKECQKVDQLIFSTIQKYQGSISAEHGVGLTKKPFLHFSRSAAEIQILRDLKKVFDPKGIINPGKVI